MTDDRLRAMERRFRESGSVEDEATWLIERVRSGDLSSDCLRLAACCGHPAACLATGVSGPGDLGDFSPANSKRGEEQFAAWTAWVDRLLEFSAARFKVLLSCGELVAQSGHPDLATEDLEAALDKARAEGTSREAMFEVCSQLGQLLPRFANPVPGDDLPRHALAYAMHLTAGYTAVMTHVGEAVASWALGERSD